MTNIGQNSSNVQMLVPVQEAAFGKEQIPTINGRDLHEFLEVKTRYNDWINARIKDYNFVENPVKGRPTKEYHLSLDMTKELSMVERNEKGRQARRYFIACEKQAKSLIPSLPKDPVVAALVSTAVSLDKTIERVDRLEADIEELRKQNTAQIIQFPQEPTVPRWRSGPKLHRFVQASIRGRGLTMRELAGAIGYAPSTMSDAIRKSSKGPVSWMILKDLKKYLLGGHK